MEIETKLSSNRLFHFTSTKDNLLSILDTGFKPRYSLEKLGILNEHDFFSTFAKAINLKVSSDEMTDEFYILMCCFCDIPLYLVNDHIKMYGDYSIGLKKEWGIKHEICPVFYINDTGETRMFLEKLMNNFHRNIIRLHKTKQTGQTCNSLSDENFFSEILDFYNTFIDLTLYVKPYSGIYVRSENIYKDYKFYDEREWRYIPDKFENKPFITKMDFEIIKKNTDSKTIKNIDFDITDITNIIVPENEVVELRKAISEIPKFQNFDLSLIDSLNNNKCN